MSFRFETLEIWQEAVELSLPLLAVAEDLESRKLYRFAEQLRGAVLSITNNIAEGSGSTSNKEFSHFLNISRRSLFEVANMLLVFRRANHLDEDVVQAFLPRLDSLSRRITAFSRSLPKP
jgi:four helix bundle protein